MCLLGISFWQSPEFPVRILANREEFYARPSAAPRLFPREPGAPAWFGGIDLAAGGTWLGENEYGLIAAVTNRAKTAPPPVPPSRGWLCRKLLAERETASAQERAMHELREVGYAGCNLLIADRRSAVIIEAGDILKSTSLESGLHLIANGAIDDPSDDRIARVRRELIRANPATIEDWFREAARLCALPAQNGESAICLVGADRGTVSSSVLGLAGDLAQSRFWHAPGPPDRAAYDDLSGELRSLFAVGPIPDIEPPENSPARRAVRENRAYGILQTSQTPAGVPYRIHLRGPWQIEPVARAEAGRSGAIRWTAASLPHAGTVRLPASWQELFGDFPGRVRFRRNFHPPSNLDRRTRLFIVLDQVEGSGTVLLNARKIGVIEPGRTSARFEITGALQLNNELEIELEFTDTESVRPGGLSGPVVLEIQEPRDVVPP